MKLKLAAALSLALAAPFAVAQATQGVTRDTIVIGTIQDLSGPIAAFGKQARNGMQLRVDEINEQGGVNGRKLKLLVEDSAYDPRKAVLAAQKLVNQEKIFAMLGHIGTAQNMAAMPVQFEKGVVNFFPLSGAREMFDPHHRLKFAFSPTYYDQVRLALPRLAKDKNAKKVCTFYQDDEFGLEVDRGAEAGAKAANLQVSEKTSFKRGATDFSSQVAKLKASGCDLVVMGTIIRETVGAIAEARKIGYNPTFLGTTASYTELIHKLGGKAVEGFYSTMVSQFPYLDEASQPIRFWATKYKTKFNEDPAMFSVYGYEIVDAFVAAARKAGPNLTTESFVKAMEGITIPSNIFGSPEQKFTATQRLGSNLSRLAQIQDGKWKVVSDYVKP